MFQRKCSQHLLSCPQDAWSIVSVMLVLGDIERARLSRGSYLGDVGGDPRGAEIDRRQKRLRLVRYQRRRCSSIDGIEQYLNYRPLYARECNNA